MLEIDKDTVIEAIHTYCKRPVYRSFQKTYNAECPVCGEGHSAGRKRRLFYFVDKGYFYCHNCARSWSEAEWLKDVAGLTWFDLHAKRREVPTLSLSLSAEREVKIQEEDDLPPESIDISDEGQVRYYSKDPETFSLIEEARRVCSIRRLYTAVNTCNRFFVSSAYGPHQNRLIIPFYDMHGHIASYQSRSLFADQFPRYLTKLNSDKPLFGLNNFDEEVPYIFVFEGPIDSMFVKNGVAMGAASLSELQKEQLRELVGYTPIFVYDNDPYNKTVVKKIRQKLDEKQKVFWWPEQLNNFKDLNEICVAGGIDDFGWEKIAKLSCVSEARAEVLFRMWRRI